MTRKSTKSASREWSGPRPTPEAVRTPPYGFHVPQQNASVHADPWTSGECRIIRLMVVTDVSSTINLKIVDAFGTFVPMDIRPRS